MLDTRLLRQNSTIEFRRDFAIGLLLLNALYWQQCDEDVQTELPGDYSSSIPLKNFYLLDDIDLEEIDIYEGFFPHFQDISNLQRLAVWYDVYSRIITNREWAGKNCLIDSAIYSLLAILVNSVDNELKFDSSIQSKVDKFSRRIAIYQLEILDFDNYPIHSPAVRIYEDFPLTLEEAISLIPLEYKICNDQATLEHKKHLFNASEFSLPREKLISELRLLQPNEYGTFLHVNVPYLKCNLDVAYKLIDKYGDEYFITPRNIEDKNIDRWNELFTYFRIDFDSSCLLLSCNDINSSYSQIKALVDQFNQEALDEYSDTYSIYSPDYFLIRDYVNSLPSLSREQAMLQLVQLILYKLYAGKSFQFEDVEKLSGVVTSLRQSSSVQSALALTAYQCGALIKSLGIEPCEYGLAAIAELFPSLRIFFQRGLNK